MIIMRSTQTKKGDRAFHVVTTANNGEILKTSESLTSKANCWKNIISDIKNYYGCTLIDVLDETGKKPVMWYYDVTRKHKGRKIANGIIVS